MTLSEPLDLDAPVLAECNVCAHSMVAHDPIAARYCRATMTNTLTRRCICTPAELKDVVTYSRR